MIVGSETGDGLPRAEAVTEALRTVIDPELGENVVDLGLIYFLAIDQQARVHVVMTTTTPGCPAVGYLREGVERAARGVPGVAAAEVAVTHDPPWTPDRMSVQAQRQPPAKRRSWWSR